MKNYMVHFQESERETVLNVLAGSNDIIVNKVEPDNAFITIQPEDSDTIYNLLLDKLDYELRGRRSAYPDLPK